MELLKKDKPDKDFLNDAKANDFFANHFQSDNDSFYSDLDENENLGFDHEHEGQLAVDVFQTKDAVFVRAAVAGVKPEDLDISLHNDMLTIRGKREIDQKISEEDYYYRECYWGGFSRAIILPTDVLADKISASFKHGILTIILPKADSERRIGINVDE